MKLPFLTIEYLKKKNNWPDAPENYCDLVITHKENLKYLPPSSPALHSVKCSKISPDKWPAIMQCNI